MMRTLHYLPGRGSQPETIRPELDKAEIRSFFDNPSGLLWVDFQSRSEDCEQLMEEILHLHPLAIDDALRETHLPKFDDWGPYLYVVLYALSGGHDSSGTQASSRLDTFMGNNFLLTIHDDLIPELEQIWEHAMERHDLLNYGAVYLLYQLADEILAAYVSAVEELENRYSHLQRQMLEDSTPEVMGSYLGFKSDLLGIERTLEPQRVVLEKLTKGETRLIDERARVYFHDVAEHLVRLCQDTAQLRELASNSLRTYRALQVDRSRMLLVILILIVALFIPLSCVFAFFGMNFLAPGARYASLVGFPLLVLMALSVLAIPGLLIWWLRNKGWLQIN